jgi:hypothetical protein
VVTQVSRKDRAESAEPRAQKETDDIGGRVMRVLPRKDGMLCGRGRFGLLERDRASDYSDVMYIDFNRDELSALRSSFCDDTKTGVLGVSISPALTNGEMAEAYALAQELGAEIFTLAGGSAVDEDDPVKLLNKMIHAAPLKKHDKSELYFIHEYPNRRGLAGLGVTRRENLKGIDALLVFGETPELTQLEGICRTLIILPKRGLFAHDDSYTRCDGRVIKTGL